MQVRITSGKQLTIPVCSAPTACAARPGSYPLDPPTVRRLGAALVRALPHGTESPQFLSAATRASRAAGSKPSSRTARRGEGAVGDERRRRADAGGRVPDAHRHGYDAGVVISASHNPFEDNGIKVFSGKGEKFTERVEREVEAIVADALVDARRPATPAHVPRADLVGAYLDHLRAVFPEAPALDRLHAGHRLRQRRDDDGGAGAVQQPRLRRRS